MIIFCTSEEPPATNAWVQYRVITSFKLLHLKVFYIANVGRFGENLSFVTSRNGVSSLPETWKISQNIKFCMNMRCFGQFYSLYVMVWQQTPEHLFQNLGSESRTYRKFDFPSKKKVSQIFFRKWQNSKSGKKNYD